MRDFCINTPFIMHSGDEAQMENSSESNGILKRISGMADGKGSHKGLFTVVPRDWIGLVWWCPPDMKEPPK